MHGSCGENESVRRDLGLRVALRELQPAARLLFKKQVTRSTGTDRTDGAADHSHGF